MAAKTQKAPRVVPTVDPRIKSLEEVDQAILKHATAQRELERIEGILNDEISTIRAKHADAIQSQKEIVDELERDLNEYLTHHADELFDEKTRSVPLTHGEINARFSSKVNLTRTKCDRIAELKLRFKGALKDVVIRTVEEVNKKGIQEHASDLDGRQLSAFKDKLQLCGVALEREETYGWAPYEDQIAKNAGKRPADVKDVA